MTDFTEKLKAFLQDPVDKCFDIQTHKNRAKEYAEIIGISDVDKIKGPDEIASCMVRSFLPRPENYKLKEEDIYQNFDEIRHPLSEEKITLEAWNKDDIFEKFKSVFEKLTSKLPKEDKEKFFYLWRNLMEKVFEEFKDSSLCKIIPILPADTRIPDHSIWEHLKIAAAINAFENIQNNSLLLFSIGPVQGFISQARKTQDLFMGSFILSYLTFKAIETVAEEYGPTNIVYPDLYRQPLMDDYLEKKGVEIKNSFSGQIDQPTIPNRFVAIIPVTEENKIKNLVGKIEDHIKKTCKNIRDEVLNAFQLKDKISQDLINRQTKDFPEIYWTAIPLKIGSVDVKVDDFKEFFEEKERMEEKRDEIKRWQELEKFISDNGEHKPNIGFLYQLAYSVLEKSMGVRKNLRGFDQIEEYGKKCHLCGEREGVIEAIVGNLKVGRYISSKESLCIRCFTKRALDKYLSFPEIFGNRFKDYSFPSTAEIACSDFKERVLKEAQDFFNQYAETFKRVIGEDNFKQVKVQFIPKINRNYSNIGNIEGEWFFEENLRQKEFEDQFAKLLDEQQIKELNEKLKEITDKFGKPNPYYAIIAFDGDFMGEWLSGERLPSLESAYNSKIWEKLPEDFKKELEKFTNYKKILTPAIHASISHALRNYSIEFVRKIVEEEHLGKLVYSGGDDVLAFVNLKDLFEVMRKLRFAFSGHIKIVNGQIEVEWNNNTGFVEKDGRYLLTMGPKASASAGIVIAHYKTPLKIVIEKVRNMEKKAKDLEDKDAFGVALMKHSGQLKEFVCKWKVDDKDVVEMIKNISNYFKEESKPKLSGTFPYKLNESLNRLKDKDGKFYLSGGIFAAEIKRTLTRSTEEAREKEKKEAVNKLYEILSFIFWNAGIGEDIGQFIDLLEFARFMAKPEE